MIDPHKKARDADRNAAVEVVEAAFADGQISRPDYDIRVDRLLRATTVGEIQMLVQDLQPTEDVAVPVSKPTISRPRVNPSAVKLVFAAVVAVFAVGLVVPLVIVSRVDSDESFSTGVVSAGDTVDLTTAKGYNRLVREVEAKTRSTTIFNAVVYPGYAVIEVPEDAESQRSYGWYFDGEWDEWTGKGTADEDRFDLDRIKGRAVAALVERVQGLVEDPTSSYVIVNSQGREEGVCLSAYASNDYNETACLDARCDGTVVRTYNG